MMDGADRICIRSVVDPQLPATLLVLVAYEFNADFVIFIKAAEVKC